MLRHDRWCDVCRERTWCVLTIATNLFRCMACWARRENA